MKLFPTDSLQGIGQVLPNGSVHRLERHPHPEGGDTSCRTSPAGRVFSWCTGNGRQPLSRYFH